MGKIPLISALVFPHPVLEKSKLERLGVIKKRKVLSDFIHEDCAFCASANEFIYFTTGIQDFTPPAQGALSDVLEEKRKKIEDVRKMREGKK